MRALRLGPGADSLRLVFPSTLLLEYLHALGSPCPAHLGQGAAEPRSQINGTHDAANTAAATITPEAYNAAPRSLARASYNLTHCATCRVLVVGQRR